MPQGTTSAAGPGWRARLLPMRVFAVFLLLAMFLGGGCQAPAREPEIGFRDVLAIPAGFPDDGDDPCTATPDGNRDVWVVGMGTVDRILRDDTRVPRHQRFIVRVCPDRTLLFAHNIDLAPRVPMKRGDTLAFRGQYEANDQGGVVHWTHRDKRNRNAGGWIIWKGQNFR